MNNITYVNVSVTVSPHSHVQLVFKQVNLIQNKKHNSNGKFQMQENLTELSKKVQIKPFADFNIQINK